MGGGFGVEAVGTPEQVQDMVWGKRDQEHTHWSTTHRPPGGHPEGGRTRGEGSPARHGPQGGSHGSWGSWRDTPPEAPPTYGPHQPPCCQDLAGSCLWSLGVCLRTPDPLQSRARGGGLCQQTSQGQTGPWGLSPTQRAPPPFPQHWLQSSLTGPYQSPGHHMPPHRPHLLPLCPRVSPVSVSTHSVLPSQLQPPSPGKCSSPCVPQVPPSLYAAQLTR